MGPRDEKGIRVETRKGESWYGRRKQGNPKHLVTESLLGVGKEEWGVDVGTEVPPDTHYSHTDPNPSSN